ncbi:DUF3575 domain-containing protein [Echinicola jeungdonensis]|uniref:DUF3575 domain-containing protein n=1 Tax=Echinicola jeungdonensis TaxID=709343 RepID=A0ABV5J1A4_9BACT|nr:DUF3575 domain-containing protein [Echinicola jeungdonensis]MDN3668432.1 DUF3575 domain-containing protein [Echinicola jeungdonensis]
MKKFTAILLLSIGFVFNSFAQSSEEDYKKNEVKLNILNTIVQGSVELGYEYFLGIDQSIGVEYMINDRFGYNAQGSGGKDYRTNSFQVAYNFYFLNEADISNSYSSIYVYPFFKYRYGEFKEDNEPDIDMNSTMIGIGVGYKWVRNNKFTIAPYVNIARGFSEEVENRFTAVEINAGASIGYRF